MFSGMLKGMDKICSVPQKMMDERAEPETLEVMS
jgi:hypothetical protein